MLEGEVEHQHWTHAQLDPQARSAISGWPYIIETEFEGVKTTFLHSALGPFGRDTLRITPDLDPLFALYPAALIFYGHRHESSDVQGRARYVNPSSLGCYTRPVARYCLVDFIHGQYTIELCAVSYEDTALYKTFETRSVPDRTFIYKVFFGGRWLPQP
jgi:hypothetical protein